MLKNPRLGAVVFYVEDLERTAAFYRDVMDIQTQREEGHDGPFLVGKARDVVLVFFRGDRKPGRTPLLVFTLEEGGIDDVVEQLARQGVQIVLPVSEAPDGGLSSDFLDPDGHVLSVYQPADAPRRREEEAA